MLKTFIQVLDNENLINTWIMMLSLCNYIGISYHIVQVCGIASHTLFKCYLN